jgi:hypothetical protein
MAAFPHERIRSRRAVEMTACGALTHWIFTSQGPLPHENVTRSKEMEREQ